jgi:hypothetical protein
MEKGSSLYIHVRKYEFKSTFWETRPPDSYGFIRKKMMYDVELFLNEEKYMKNLEKKFFLKSGIIDEFTIFKNAYVIPVAFIPVHIGIYKTRIFVHISSKVYFTINVLLVINDFKNGVVEPNPNYWDYRDNKFNRIDFFKYFQ